MFLDSRLNQRDVNQYIVKHTGYGFKQEIQQRDFVLSWGQTLELTLGVHYNTTIKYTLYLAIQMLHTSLGLCLRGHSTWAGLNEPSLDFAFSFEVALNFDVAFLAGTLKPLA